MMESVRIFVDEDALSVPAGITVHQAVALHNAEAAAAVEAGSAYLTDGVGRRIAPAVVVTGGAIIRVIRSAPPAERGGD